MLDSLQGIKGYDEQAFVAVHKTAPITSVRLHPTKGNSLFADEDIVPWCSSGRYLTDRPSFTLDPLFHSGGYYVQEASSMFLDHVLRHVLKDRKALRVLDLCGAPGGKSTLIASLLDEESLLVSNEVIRSRASILEENMGRWGYMNTWVASNDPKDIGKLKGYFDVVVVDAPCSGSGMFRKDEKAINEWSEGNVALCAERQQRIVADVWPSLKEGGILVYSTCSYSVAENEAIADWLAESFEVKGISIPVSEEWGVVETISQQKSIPCYRFFPHKVKGEGLFMTVVQKLNNDGELKMKKSNTLNDKQAYDACKHLLNTDDFSCIQHKEQYVAIRPYHEEDYQLLQQYIYLRKAGVELGVPVKKDWIPAHELALNIYLSDNVATVALTKEQALKFLKKEDPGLGEPEKGWYCVTYAGCGLGWIKALGNRVNNYLPKHWRIRMEISDADWA